MKNELIKISRNLSGKVLVIGFPETDKVIEVLDKNKKVTEVSYLTQEIKGKTKKVRTFFKDKQISIKKLYKDLGKEKYDYIIVDFYTIRNKFNKFIINSYKINPKEIYILLEEDLYDYEEIMNRYVRYKAKVSSKGKNGEYLITIDMGNMIIKLLRKLLFNIRDFFYNVYEFIANAIIA